ncbi:hypothetical protein HPT25_19535 [Bacillus sp. BRMEA1]|uniref:hypothetical protein n=1 Tax=Neobacillus endophyticus TaxID=2738405 RepID=UPI0015652E9D|nr:hypothetical protein [Neobacillus endophyticus]NRD79557.1 hypothetical protein [Neobacillus endophyticus]
MNGFTRGNDGRLYYYVNGQPWRGRLDLTYQTGYWWYFDNSTGAWTGWIWSGTYGWYYWNGSQWIHYG